MNPTMIKRIKDSPMSWKIGSGIVIVGALIFLHVLLNGRTPVPVANPPDPELIRAAEERDRKVEEAKAAATKAEQEAFAKTKAGQICKAHPEWTRDDCEKLAEGKVWIGMSAAMLVYERGKADRVNKSNYGSGDVYQACWDDYTPSCFYDNDNDGLADAYN